MRCFLSACRCHVLGMQQKIERLLLWSTCDTQGLTQVTRLIVDGSHEETCVELVITSKKVYDKSSQLVLVACPSYISAAHAGE